MDSFRWIAVVLSMILGLGITRLLSALVAMFRARRRAEPDWLPLAWAGCIFVWQLQFWWSVFELTTMIRAWTLGHFLALVALTLLLFVAAALVLPPNESAADEDMSSAFAHDGRWSLLALCGYFVVAAVTDRIFWRMSPISWDAALFVPLIAVPLAFLATRSRRVQVVLTCGYVLLSVGAATVFSPWSYG